MQWKSKIYVRWLIINLIEFSFHSLSHSLLSLVGFSRWTKFFLLLNFMEARERILTRREYLDFSFDEITNRKTSFNCSKSESVWAMHTFHMVQLRRAEAEVKWWRRHMITWYKQTVCKLFCVGTRKTFPVGVVAHASESQFSTMKKNIEFHTSSRVQIFFFRSIHTLFPHEKLR